MKSVADICCLAAKLAIFFEFSSVSVLISNSLVSTLDRNSRKKNDKYVKKKKKVVCIGTIKLHYYALQLKNVLFSDSRNSSILARYSGGSCCRGNKSRNEVLRIDDNELLGVS